jgi:hypothetical protein
VGLPLGGRAVWGRLATRSGRFLTVTVPGEDCVAPPETSSARATAIALQYKLNPKSPLRRILLADDKLYKAEYLGSGTFSITKPKRKKTKARQSQLKNPQRGSRK